MNHTPGRDDRENASARRGWRAALPCALLAAGLLSGAHADWAPPDDLSDRLDSLDPTQTAFLTSGAVLDFIPERQLEHELAKRDADALLQLVNDLMNLAVEMGYDPSRDMGAIPLNLSSKRYNPGEPTPEALRKTDRAPGPFSVHRYLFPRSGVPTFGGARVAVWPEDLVAGSVDVAIVGVPSNMSSGRRDSGAGPSAMRALNTIAAPDDQSLVAPLETLSVVDYGDFATDGLSVERTVAHVTERVRETAATGAVPALVGGDTSLLYAAVKGVTLATGGGDAASLGLLHFSAHPDANRQDDHTISDDQAVFALIEEGIVAGEDTVLLGLRGPDVTRDTLAWLRDRNVRYHTATEIRDRGFERVLDRMLAEVRRGPDRWFVSVDVSVVDPGDLVAAGRIAPHGLPVAEVTRAIRHVCAAKEIAGFEVTDLAPMLDVSRLSALHANALLNACLVGMAVRAEGLDPEFIHPLVRDDGRR